MKVETTHSGNNLTWIKISALAVILLTLTLWGIPLIELGTHYYRWKSHQIGEYDMQICFIGNGFIKNDLFEPITNDQQ